MKYRTKIERVVKFIMKRPDEELAVLSVAKLADIFHIERSTLAREFKFHREVTLEYYLCREKIIRTAFLLVYQAGISISQVAEQMGFCSCQYFSRVFEKIFGIKPRKYRKYQQLRSGGKDRREVEVANRRVNIQRPSVVLSMRCKNPGDRRQVVQDHPRNIVEIMPIMPVEPIYPAYSIQGLLRMMRENEMVNG
jgi:AraC-like DNA-binding protein